MSVIFSHPPEHHPSPITHHHHQERKRENLLHHHQTPRQIQRRHNRRHSRQPHQPQLQRGIILANRRRPDLRTGQRKVPIPRHRLRRRQRDPAEVQSRNSQRHVPPQDNDGQPDGQQPLGRQRHGKHRHERLVGHGVDDGSYHGALVPSPRDPAVQKVGHARVGEETEGPGVMVVQDAVADEGGGDEAREGQPVGDGVDVFALGDGAGLREGGFESCCGLGEARRGFCSLKGSKWVSEASVLVSLYLS